LFIVLASPFKKFEPKLVAYLLPGKRDYSGENDEKSVIERRRGPAPVGKIPARAIGKINIRCAENKMPDAVDFMLRRSIMMT